MKLFIKSVCPSSGDTILDVGGYPGFWENFKTSGLEITCLNKDFALENSSAGRQKRISCVHGDGCSLSYGDQSFSVAFSNSVIEHVGDWAKQKAFAQEILRVGRKIWVQTPAYECPIEPHFLTPFFHWLPKVWRIKLARNFTLWGWIERPEPEKTVAMVNEIHLLKKEEFIELFPACEIVTEKLFGFFPKSYIAIRQN